MSTLRRFTAIIELRDPVRRGTLMSIVRQSQLTKTLFEEDSRFQIK